MRVFLGLGYTPAGEGGCRDRGGGGGADVVSRPIGYISMLEAYTKFLGGLI